VRDRFDTFENQPTLRGAGVITGKQDGALVFEVEDQSATYTPDREVFDRIEVGDRVAVLYQRSRTGGRIRIIEVGTARMR
jgi:hypothetical protein